MKTLETIVVLLLSLAFIASQINIIRYACTEYKRSKQVKHSAKCRMKPIEKWFMRRMETMVCRILSREGKAPTSDNITNFLKDALDELAEERRDDYYMGS